MNDYYTDTAKQQLKELEKYLQMHILDKVALIFRIVGTTYRILRIIPLPK